MMPRAAPGPTLARAAEGNHGGMAPAHYLRSLTIKVTDELTGLYNRRYLLSSLDELIDRVGRDDTSADVLLFDIDHFKLINDTHGHVVGDGVLRDLVNLTLNSVRSVDLVARQGGEEFVVVMPETDLTIAAAVAERLRAAVAKEPFTVRANGQKLTVTISIGVTSVAAADDDRERILKRADIALYTAKNQGRNRVVVRSLEGLPRAVA